MKLLEYAMEQQRKKLTGEMLHEEYEKIFPSPYTRVAYPAIHAEAQARWEKLAENLNQKLAD